MSTQQGASAPTKTVPRDVLLEYQIRYRGLSFAEAKEGLGYCCRPLSATKLAPTGYCWDCARENARGDCACTLREACAYHDRTTHYCCGASILKKHDSLCREALRG